MCILTSSLGGSMGHYHHIWFLSPQRQDRDADRKCDGFQRGPVYDKMETKVDFNSQACLGGGQFSEAELQYRRPLPMCSFSDLACRWHFWLPNQFSKQKTATDRGEDGEARREVNEEKRITEFLTAIALCHTVQVGASNFNIKIIFDCR